MARPYSVDLRERVLQFYDDGNPVEDTAQHFSVSESWVYSLLKQRRETGNIAPKERPTTYNTKLTPHEQEVRASIAEHVDATLSERCELLEKLVSVSRSTLCRFLKRLKISFKKKLSTLPNNIVKMSSRSEVDGVISCRASTIGDSFSLMRPGLKRT